MNRRVLKKIQIIGTILLFLLVFYQGGLFSPEGRAEFLQVLKQASIGLLILSILTSLLANSCSAMKWLMVCRSQGMQVGFFRLLAFYLIGIFYSLVLPTSVGGDVVRSYELGKFTNNQAGALASVFVERYTGVIALFLFAFFGVVTHLSTFNVNFVIFSLIAFAVGVTLIGWVTLDHRLYEWVKEQVTSRFSVTQGVFTKADKLMAAVRAYKDHPAALVWAMVNSVVFYFVAVLNVYVSSLVFDLDVQFLDILIATPIIMLIMNIPVSIGNLGLMEFAYITIFQMMGYSPSLGLSVAVLMRLKTFIDGAMGGILQPIYTTRKYGD